MAKIAFIAAIAAAVFSGVTMAKNCKHGLDYCGYNLLGKGNYYADILGSLQAAGEDTDPTHVDNSLFYCKGNDDIPFIKFCAAGCINGGSGNSDWC